MTTTPLKLPWVPWIGKRPFYGWLIAEASAVLQTTQNISNQGFGTYFTFLQREFGWSRAIMAAPRSVTQMENAILGPIEGFLIDRIGPRAMIIIGTFIMGLGMILFGQTNSLWMFFLSNILVTFGTSFQGALVQSVTLNRWFLRKRTMAHSIMLLGPAVAGIIGVPAVVFIQLLMGWRQSAVLTGVLIWVLGFPLSLLFCRSPEPYGLAPDGDSNITPSSGEKVGTRRIVEESGLTLREALHTRAFWLLAVSQAAGNLGMGALQVHLFLHLEQGVGLAHTTAAFIWTIASLVNIPAKIFVGFMGDRIPKNIILGSSIMVLALASFILGVATSLPMAVIYAVVYGIGWGARGPVNLAIQGEYFHGKHQGMIRGWLAVFPVPFTIVTPIVAGYVADVQGSYRLVFIVTALLVSLGAIAAFLATHPKRRSAVTISHQR